MRRSTRLPATCTSCAPRLLADASERAPSDVCRDTLAEAFRTWRDDVAVALRQSQHLGLVRNDADAGDLADLLTESWEGAVIRMKIERSLAPLHRVVARLLDDYFKPPA
jgi:TetR/AcrR family transcriptional regulator, transcriptional repressor for nem operon